jgi:Tol biopolymer transport system component
MSDLKALLERADRAVGDVPLPAGGLEELERRRDRRRRNQRIRAGALGLVIAIAVGWLGMHAIRTAPIPAAPPVEPSVDLGIFDAVSGRIVYCNSPDLWAVDPSAPSPVSTAQLVGDRLCAPTFTLPLGWSSDGTELLFLREDPTDQRFPYDSYLYILHADGTETQVTSEPVEGAAISPDGSRVAFAAEGLYIVDAEGGHPVRIAHEGNSPTFSPDGTQIAYLGLPRDGCCVETGREHVWVANADGTGAHEILADEPALARGVFELTWSPAVDRIAMGNGLERHVAIYTFAPDGSDFTKVIDDGLNPFWSPDGSQIAYGAPGSDGLWIADADGSNIQTFPIGGPGPWHPGG